MQEVESAFLGPKTQPPGFPSGHWLGESDAGVPIRFQMSGGNMISAYPFY